MSNCKPCLSIAYLGRFFCFLAVAVCSEIRLPKSAGRICWRYLVLPQQERCPVSHSILSTNPSSPRHRVQRSFSEDLRNDWTGEFAPQIKFFHSLFLTQTSIHISRGRRTLKNGIILLIVHIASESVRPADLERACVRACAFICVCHPPEVLRFFDIFHHISLRAPLSIVANPICLNLTHSGSPGYKTPAVQPNRVTPSSPPSCLYPSAEQRHVRVNKQLELYFSFSFFFFHNHNALSLTCRPIIPQHSSSASSRLPVRGWADLHGKIDQTTRCKQNASQLAGACCVLRAACPYFLTSFPTPRKWFRWASAYNPPRLFP